MTSPLAKTTELPVNVRFAEPADAQAISELYVRTYTPIGGGAAHEHYPFPQIMEEDQVIDLLTSGTVLWVVAQLPDGKIAGSAAAVRNIGGRHGRIAEIFGVAVEQSCRRHGVGSAMLQKLQAELARIAEFTLCEARTAEAGGWKAARNAGLRPVGFEPYAHAMPIGFESMVLTASWNSTDPSRPPETPPAENTGASLKLAQIVCGSAPAKSLSTADTVGQLSNPGLQNGNEVYWDSLNVRRDDRSGQQWFADSTDRYVRQSAVVEFWPFHGVEPRYLRFENAYYVASNSASDIAAARVFYDRIDARARILGLRVMTPGVESQFIQGIVENLLQLSNGGPLVVIVCVSACAPATQMGLEVMGFIPTAYFPGMITVEADRADVIQYTRLFGRSWPESTRLVTATEWPEARRIIDQILRSTCSSPASSSTSAL